jgi:hypothetical protein
MHRLAPGVAFEAAAAFVVGVGLGLVNEIGRRRLMRRVGRQTLGDGDCRAGTGRVVLGGERQDGEQKQNEKQKYGSICFHRQKVKVTAINPL